MDDVTKMMLDDDISHSRELWDKFGDDPKRMGGLFDMLIMRYKDIVDGFADDLEVVSSFDSGKDVAERYKNNVHKLINRLEIFKDCGYSNEELARHYINEGVEGTSYNLSFNETRSVISGMKIIKNSEKEEILSKIDNIESIVMSVDTKRNKWNQLRPYIIWITGKDVSIAMLLLPLIMKIN